MVQNQDILRRYGNFGRFGVKSSPSDGIAYAAEDPQKADRTAAAPRTENVCHKQVFRCRYCRTAHQVVYVRARGGSDLVTPRSYASFPRSLTLRRMKMAAAARPFSN